MKKKRLYLFLKTNYDKNFYVKISSYIFKGACTMKNKYFVFCDCNIVNLSLEIKCCSLSWNDVVQKSNFRFAPEYRKSFFLNNHTQTCHKLFSYLLVSILKTFFFNREFFFSHSDCSGEFFSLFFLNIQ